MRGIRDRIEHHAAVVAQVRAIRPCIAVDRTIQRIDRVAVAVKRLRIATECAYLITQCSEQILRQSHSESFSIHRDWGCDTEQLQDCWRDINRLDLTQRA